MKKVSIKDIDPDKFAPQHMLAKELKTTRQRISNWIHRGQIDAVYVKEFDLVLVDRTSIKKIRKYEHRSSTTKIKR